MKSFHRVLAKLRFDLKELRNKKQEVIWDHLSGSSLPTAALDKPWQDGAGHIILKLGTNDET